MDDIEQLKQDVREGRIDSDRLVDLVATLQANSKRPTNGLRTWRNAPAVRLPRRWTSRVLSASVQNLFRLLGHASGGAG
jgi:hypothetical protein